MRNDYRHESAELETAPLFALLEIPERITQRFFLRYSPPMDLDWDDEGISYGVTVGASRGR